jgi:hypothetical protein
MTEPEKIEFVKLKADQLEKELNRKGNLSIPN